MTPEQIHNLIQVGGEERCRLYLKKLALPQRMETLRQIIPWVKETPKSLKFYYQNFAIEIGALLKADYDIEQAVQLYRRSKLLSR
jgi:hypothetical protein